MTNQDKRRETLPDESGVLSALAQIVHVSLDGNSIHYQGDPNFPTDESKLKTLFEIIPVGISVLDANGKIKFVNPALEKILDITFQGILNGDYHKRQYLRSDGEIMQESEFASSIADLENRAIHNIETGIVKENGQVIWTNVSAVPVAFSDWHMILVTADVTDRKHREEKLSQLAAIVESSENIILSKDLDGTITSWNKGAEAIYGYTAGEVIGKPVFMLSPHGLEEESKQLLEKIKSGSSVEHFETIRKTKSGEIIHVSLSISPVRNAFGKITGASTIGHNITGRIQMEAELIQKNEQLIRLNIEKDKFLSIVAHDLRSPFNSFLGFTKLLDEELSSFKMEEIQEFASNMRKSADKLFLFLENLLEWSSIQHGLGIFRSEPFELHKGIESAIEIVREIAVKKLLEIKQNIPDDIAVTADLHMFRSLVRNLVFNAIKFTHRGGKITISARLMPDNSAEVSISDTGIGMSKEMIGKLFHLDQYVSRAGTEEEPSSGLGLIICKEYVEKHGGKIWVESEEGVGSTFYFTIPSIHIH
jgi:PAS domain S-box-containing protein